WRSSLRRRQPGTSPSLWSATPPCCCVPSARNRPWRATLAIASISSWCAGGCVRGFSKGTRHKGQGTRDKAQGTRDKGKRPLFSQDCDCRSQMGIRRVVKALHQRMLLERGLDDAALHATPATVNQSNLSKSRG